MTHIESRETVSLLTELAENILLVLKKAVLDTNDFLALYIMVYALQREIHVLFYIDKEIRNVTNSADTQFVDAHG